MTVTPCHTYGHPVDTSDPAAFVTECGTVIECEKCREGEKETES